MIEGIGGCGAISRGIGRGTGFLPSAACFSPNRSYRNDTGSIVDALLESLRTISATTRGRCGRQDRSAERFVAMLESRRGCHNSVTLTHMTGFQGFAVFAKT